jgi:MFS family permease
MPQNRDPIATEHAANEARHRARALPPEMIIIAGCLIAILTFGPRSALGIFQLPIITQFGWGSDTFSFAMAIQYLLWGAGQPFAGAMADRYGSRRVLITGVLLYASGLVLMSVSSTPLAFDLTAGVLMGFGLSGCSFNLVIGAFSKLLPPEKRSIAFGCGTAAGSFGQFLFSPFAGAMVGNLGWQTTALVFGALMLLVVPLASAVASAPNKSVAVAAGPAPQSFRQALAEAFGHRSYVLLVLGFFTCGFQLAFVTIHFQKYVVEAGLEPSVGYWAFALVGIFNMIGSFSSGWLGNRMPRRWILSFIYLTRALATIVFIALPATPLSAYVFGAVTGLLWLSTVPPTSSLIGVMFGTRYFATLYGFAFFSHQVGGFFGLMLAGVVREQTGSYLLMWQASIFFGVVSALINLPIVEQPVKRAVAA